MTDYTKTREAASMIKEKFNQTLRNLKDELEDEIVIQSLMQYYDLCCKPDKIDNTVDEYIEPDEELLWAIERLLQDYMTTTDFNSWLDTRGNTKND